MWPKAERLPALVVTPIYGAFIAPDQTEATLRSGFDAFHPIGRVGCPEDVAAYIAFLLSERAGWTAGAVHDVDGRPQLKSPGSPEREQLMSDPILIVGGGLAGLTAGSGLHRAGRAGAC